MHCTNGAGRTGVFVAIANIIERINLEKVVDVFTTVKLLRVSCAHRTCAPVEHATFALALQAVASTRGVGQTESSIEKKALAECLMSP